MHPETGQDKMNKDDYGGKREMISHGKEIKVFAGNSNPELAEHICSELYRTLGKADVAQFADGECSVSVFEPVRGKDVFIVQSTCNHVNDNLMELLIMIVANLITTAGADRVLTMDLHAAQIQGFFDIPVDNLLGSHLFVKHFVNMFGKGNEDVMVVSPDVGSTARVRAFSMKLGVNMAIVDKRREKANQSEVMNIIGNVEGKTCILLDDIVDTAGSLCGAAKAISEIGGAKKVYACATHGVLSGPAIERIENSCIEELLLLDTIPYPTDKPACSKIKYISTAPVFAEAIRRIYEEVSISNLFD